METRILSRLQDAQSQTANQALESQGDDLVKSYGRYAKRTGERSQG